MVRTFIVTESAATSRDNTGSTAAIPIGALGRLLTCNVALRDDHDFQGSERFLIVPHAAPRAQPVADVDFGEFDGGGVAQIGGPGGDSQHFGFGVNRDCDFAGSGLEFDLTRGGVHFRHYSESPADGGLLSQAAGTLSGVSRNTKGARYVILRSIKC